MSSFFILGFPAIFNSLLRWEISNLALWITNFFPYKNQYALKRGVVNITPKSRIYPTGEFIPKPLPAAYQIGNNKINSIDNPNVPNSQYCGNCIFNQNGYCTRWQAKIKNNYWCAVWQGLGSQE